jgi:hypothetical protein
LQVKTGDVARHCRAILSHDRGRVGGNPPLARSQDSMFCLCFMWELPPRGQNSEAGETLLKGGTT